MSKVYGLLGRKLGHSWSVPLHRAFGCPDYRLIELEPEDLSTFLRREDIGGLNVTIPYKRTVMEFCDGLSEEAQAIGSVNTLVRRADGKLWGWNTDAYGFRYLADRAGVSFAGRKVVILGTGGASLSVGYVARTAGAREVVKISRSGPDNYGNLSRHADADILVNTTPVGMYPDNGAAPLSLDAFPRLRAVLDVVYNPRRTALLLQAEARKIPCADGLAMLTAQAAEAETRFCDRQISSDEIEQALAQLSCDTENIVLIGMPGCGKSVVGNALSCLTGREAVDIDAEIVKRAGKPIPDIFAESGEAAFRELERSVTAEMGKRLGVILVTGGGVVKDERNYAPLKQNGRIYHLVRDLSRLARDGRPLSQGADLSAMEAERRPLYQRFRDAVIGNNDTVKSAAWEIWRDFCAYSGLERA